MAILLKTASVRLVPFKSCKLESKTRSKVFGNVDTMEMYQSSVAFLILYVDDILLIGNDTEFLNSIKGYLNNNFLMKDLGEASYMLGIKIYRDRSRRLIRLSQSTYLDKVLKKFKMDQSKKGFLPMLQGVKLS